MARRVPSGSQAACQLLPNMNQRKKNRARAKCSSRAFLGWFIKRQTRRLSLPDGFLPSPANSSAPTVRLSFCFLSFSLSLSLSPCSCRLAKSLPFVRLSEQALPPWLFDSFLLSIVRGKRSVRKRQRERKKGKESKKKARKKTGLSYSRRHWSRHTKVYAKNETREEKVSRSGVGGEGSSKVGFVRQARAGLLQ